MKKKIFIIILINIIIFCSNYSVAAFSYSSQNWFSNIFNRITNADEDTSEVDEENTVNNTETTYTDVDTDGDGLLDNEPQIYNNKIIAPIDPDPYTYNGKEGLWQTQIDIEKNGDIPYYLTDFYTVIEESNNSLLNTTSLYDFSNLTVQNNLFSSSKKTTVLNAIFSQLLNFRLDNGGIVFHSQTYEDMYEYILEEGKNELSPLSYYMLKKTMSDMDLEDYIQTWQKQFGYNELYDTVYRKVSDGNFESAQMFCEDETGEEYVLWIWRGDYLTLGAGAEMGLYVKSDISSDEFEHWDAVDFEVPMTLYLYNYNEEDIENIFSWEPTNEQWWITGFNPNYTSNDVTKQVFIGTVDLSEHIDLYESLKENITENTEMEKFTIFDDDNNTIWIQWYE